MSPELDYKAVAKMKDSVTGLHDRIAVVNKIILSCRLLEQRNPPGVFEWHVQRVSSTIHPRPALGLTSLTASGALLTTLPERACGDCRDRKVRCDGAANGFPCSNCRSAAVLCTVPERRKRRHLAGRGNIGPQPPPPLAQEGSRVARDPGGHSGDKGSGPVSTDTAPSVPRTNDDAAGPDEDGYEAEPRPPTAEEQAGDLELSKQHLVEFFSQNLQDSPPIACRLTYVGTELSNLNHLTRQRSTNHQIYHFSCSSSYAPRVLKESQRVPTPSLISRDAFVLPPRHISDVLIAAYFQHVHATLPIIDRENFLAAYEDPKSSPPLLLLQAVCLVGSHVQTSFDNTHDLKVAFFRRTKALFDGRYEEDRMHMVQAALLMTWFSDGGDDVCANAWWWIGVACRVAIGLGMHRDVRPCNMQEADKRTWRRIWWCVVQFDLLVSLSYGRPQNINLDDCDTPPLSIDDFDSAISPIQAQFCMEHAKLCVLVSDILRRDFSVRALQSQSDLSAALRLLDQSLAEWSISLPPDLRQPKRIATMPQIDPCLLFLQRTYHAVLIQVHRLRRPASEGDLQTGVGQDNDRICADSAANIVQIVEQLSQFSALRQCWFWAPSAIFTAMLHLSTQSNCDNAIIALQAREDFTSGLQSLRRLSKHWLLAASVYRLFRSDFIREKPQDRTLQVQQSSSGAERAAIDDSLDGESPSLTVISSSNHDNQTTNDRAQQVAIDSEQNMDWVNLFAFDLTAQNDEDMRFQPNRWQDSFSEWQTLHWNDSVASFMLSEANGEYPLH